MPDNLNALHMNDPTLTNPVATEVNARQDEVMAEISDDGRPPNKELRRHEWRWFAVGAAVAAIGLGTWLIASGVEGVIIVVGLLYAFGLLALASPALVVGLTRAKEEHEAKEVALHEHHTAAPR